MEFVFSAASSLFTPLSISLYLFVSLQHFCLLLASRSISHLEITSFHCSCVPSFPQNFHLFSLRICRPSRARRVFMRNRNYPTGNPGKVTISSEDIIGTCARSNKSLRRAARQSALQPFAARCTKRSRKSNERKTVRFRRFPWEQFATNRDLSPSAEEGSTCANHGRYLHGSVCR